MTVEHDRFMAALFEQPGREHVDVKLWVRPFEKATKELLCDEAARLIEHLHTNDGTEDETFDEGFESRPWREVLAA